MTFDQWFSNIGARCHNFSAYDWARSGWEAHRMHGANGMIETDPIPEEVRLLEDKNET